MADRKKNWLDCLDAISEEDETENADIPESMEPAIPESTIPKLPPLEPIYDYVIPKLSTPPPQVTKSVFLGKYTPTSYPPFLPNRPYDSSGYSSGKPYATSPSLARVMDRKDLTIFDMMIIKEDDIRIAKQKLLEKPYDSNEEEKEEEKEETKITTREELIKDRQDFLKSLNIQSDVQNLVSILEKDKKNDVIKESSDNSSDEDFEIEGLQDDEIEGKVTEKNVEDVEKAEKEIKSEENEEKEPETIDPWNFQTWCEKFPLKEIDIKMHFTPSEYRNLSHHQKSSYKMQKRTYIVCSKSGMINKSLPVFMRPKREKILDDDGEEVEESASEESDEEWRPDGLTKRQRKTLEREKSEKIEGRRIIKEQAKAIADKDKKKKVKRRKVKELKVDKEERKMMDKLATNFADEADFLGFTKNEIVESENRAKTMLRKLEKMKENLEFLSEKDISKVVSLHEEKEEIDDTRRYPRRSSIKRTDYSEIEGLQDDDYIFCEDCQAEYEAECPYHPWVQAINTTIEPGVKNRARLTCPTSLRITKSTIPGAGLGVKAKIDIPKRVMFGPYEGVKQKTENRIVNSVYCWEICINGEFSHYVDGRSIDTSNWLRYVNCARFEEEQNLMAMQFKHDIYYVSCKSITAGTELLVWYGDDFANALGIERKKKSEISDSSSEESESSESETSSSESESDEDKENVVVPVPVVVRPVVHCGLRKEKVYLPQDQVWSEKKIRDGRTVYECNVCKLISVSTCNAKKHELTHTGIRPHKCEICGKSFTLKRNLYRHLDSHNNIKNFKCDYCHKKFGTNSDLAKHKRIHTGEKPYACKHCSYRTGDHSALSRHVKTHHKVISLPRI